MPGAAADQAQAQRRGVEQVKPLGPVFCQQHLQRGLVFVLYTVRPVMNLHRRRGIAVDDLQHLPVIVQAE